MPFEKEDTIREATKNEVGWFFRNAAKRDWYQTEPPFIDCARLDYCDGFLVAEYGGEVIGAVATSSKGMDDRTLPTIANLYVFDDFTHRGVGLRLLIYSMERLLASGASKVFCTAITPGMVRTIEKLPPDLKKCLEYKIDRYSGEWACREWLEYRKQTKKT